MNYDNRKRWATIYTISSTDDCNNGTDHCVAGSYVSRERAIDELTDYVMERLSLRKDFAYAFAHDANHEEMENAVDWTDDGLVFVLKTEEEVRTFVKGMIDGDGCYYVYNEDWSDSFHFDVDENDLVLYGVDEANELLCNTKFETED